MRIPIIAGNWKMNKTCEEAIALADALKEKLSGVKGVEVVLCPPFTSLVPVAGAIKGTRFSLGAQNMYWEKEGAYTGEISGAMLKSAGCRYAIIGHSERRALFGETNETVNKKIKKALEDGLLPIMCVGEKLNEREAGKTFEVVSEHVKNGLAGIAKASMTKIIIAYEPVWAIGTGRNATPEQAEEVHKFIRGIISGIYGKDCADAVRIQYGGSVNPANIGSLIKMDDIDGALVGGASLKADSFAEIVKISSSTTGQN